MDETSIKRNTNIDSLTVDFTFNVFLRFFFVELSLQ
jgi:hypothetical protein